MSKRKKGNTGLSLKEIEAITKKQEDVFTAYDDGYNLVLAGSAGTGKTFIALYLALEEILDRNSPFRNIAIFRSAVPTRDLGFLKGSLVEKMAVYEEPYKAIVNELFQCGSAYESMKGRNKIQFMSTSFNRGITIDDTIIIVDETQNLNDHEISTIMTRLGQDSKIIFCGDCHQVDLNQHRETSGLGLLIKIATMMDEDFEVVRFDPNDIIRNQLVKRYLKARVKLGV